jgi:hypothetical protein
MTEYELRFLGKARVWLRDLPKLDCISSEVLTRTLPSHRRSAGESRRAAVEIFLPVGATVRYALMGATLSPEPIDLLKIDVPICDDNGAQVSWALAAKLDEVCGGLKREYAEAVFTGLANAGNILGGGTLIIGPAAHSTVGSSASIFQRVTETLLDILGADPASLSEGAMSRILNRMQ